MKEKVLIYPFSKQIQFLPWYLSRKNYEVMLAAPNGFNLQGVIFNHESVSDCEMIQIRTKEEIAILLQNVNTLIAVSDDGIFSPELKIENVMHIAIGLRKNVYCAVPLEDCVLDSFLNDAHIQAVEFNYFSYYERGQDISYLDKKLNDFYVPKAPVVVLGSIFEGLDKIDLALRISEKLKKDGYNTLTILPCSFAGLLNAFPIPKKVLEVELSEGDKVYYMNHFMSDLELRFAPNVFVMALPGGILPHLKVHDNDFGLLGQLITQATYPDYFICCLPYRTEPASEANLQELDSICKYRYNSKIDDIHLSNSMLDYQETTRMLSVSYYDVSYDALKERGKNWLIPESFDAHYKKLISTLHTYSDISFLI